MAEEIVDVIHRIAYDIDDSDLKTVQTDLQKQLTTLDKLGREQIALAKQYKKLADDDDAGRKRINEQMRKNTAAIKAQGVELEKVILTNKEFNKAMENEIGLINTLNYRLDVLQKRRKMATSEQEVSRYNNLIAQERAKLARLNGTQAKVPTGQGSGGIGGLTGGLTRFAAPILAGVSLVSFGKEIFDVTSKFEAYNNTLKNTFQSATKAADSFQLIKEFAAATPFSVDQVTSSYIKLVNRGFEPTKENLTEIGDLAASQGKSFDQLVEAILDAQTGEFERLKEFGIKAKTVGDTVTLSFRGIEKQVKKTDQEGLRNAVLSFGKLTGVAGAMSTVAVGLTGKISNLGDSFDELKNAIGSQNKGFFADILDGAKDVLDFFTDLVEIPVSEKIRQEQVEVNALANAIIANNGNRLVQNQLISELNSKYPEFLKGLNTEANLTQAINDRLLVYNQLATQRLNLAIQQGVVDKNQKNFTKELQSTAKEAARIKDILFNLIRFANGQSSDVAIDANSNRSKNAGLAAQKRLKELLPELKKITTSEDYKKFVEANQDLLSNLLVKNDDYKFYNFRDEFRSVLKESNEALQNEAENTKDLTKAQDALSFSQQQLTDQTKQNAEQNVKTLAEWEAKLKEVDEKIKKLSENPRSGRAKGDLLNQRQVILDNIEDLKKTLGLIETPKIDLTKTTPSKTGKKKTAAEAQKELLDEFQADLRKSLIRDEVQDFIRASQDIEADRKKRLDKIEKLEAEYKTRFDKARKTNQEIVEADLLRDREDYEQKRLKLITDNETRIADLTREAELKRASIIKNSFAIETALLQRELDNQQKTVEGQRNEALKKLQEDAQKGLYGNLQRAKDGINLPRDEQGNIIIKFVKVDDKGNPIKDAKGNFVEDIQALENFNKLVTTTNAYYDTVVETNTANHFERLLDIQIKYHNEAQAAMADFLQSQNVEISKDYAEQIQTITDAYLQGKISLKDYTDFVENQQKRLSKNQLQAQLDSLTGGTVDRGNLRRGFDINSVTGGRVGEINTILQNGGFTGKDQSGKDVFTPLDDEARNKLLKERLDLEAQILDILVKQNEARAKDKTDAEEDKKKKLLEVVQAYQDVSDAALQAASTIVSSLQASADKEIEIRQKRVDRAKEIADRGNAEALQAEEERLNQLQAKQERFARLQLGINNLLTLSNAITAVAKAAAEGGAFAPATIAAVIAALAAGFATVRGFSQDLPGFAEGVVDYQGKGTSKSDSNTVRISRHESIMTAAATAAHRPVLEAMNRGERFDIMQVGGLKMLVPRENGVVPIQPGGQGGFSDKRIADKLDDVKDAIEEQQPTTLHIDRRGIVAIVQQVLSDERRRWKV